MTSITPHDSTYNIEAIASGQLRLYIQNSPFSTAMFDREIRYIAASKRWMEINSLCDREIIGISHYDLFPELPERWKLVHSRSLAGETLTEDEDSYVRKDGSVQWFRWEVRPWNTENGEIGGIVMSSEDITERKQSELEVKKREVALNKAQEVSHVGSWMWCTQTNRLEWSDEMFNIFGIVKEGFTGDLNDVVGRAIHPDDRARVEHSNESVTKDAKPIPLEYRVVWPDGTIRTVWAEAGESINDAAGNIIALSGIVQDITERKKAEAELRVSAIAFESQEGMVITDVNGTILRVNKAYTSITGYSPEEVIGKNPRILQSGRQDSNFYKEMWYSIINKGSWDGEIWNKRKNGEVFPEHLMITAVKNSEGITTNYVGTLTDITLSKSAADEIQHLAFYDSLTQLPNRRLLMDRLKLALASSTRSGMEGALLFIDLDNFKTLNDTLGHDIGDMLLQQVARRIESTIREGDSVGRMGGDEFVVMLEGLSNQTHEVAAHAEAVGMKILTILSQPYHLSEYEYRCSASIGVTLFRDHKVRIDELFKQADIAMYQAKKAGRNALRFYDPEMQSVINARVTLENELRIAIEKQQFQLYYQVQVDSLRRPLGAEALIRWLHPERGLVPPAQFIPLAEETGLIITIGQWVLNTACAQLKAWQLSALTQHLTLSVNVSAKQFHESTFVAQVQDSVECHSIDPRMLKLEPTESILLENIDDTVATMNALKAFGVRFALDDFGTGFSSLQYLKKLPLNQLKIDQSFVRDLVFDANDQAIVRTIIAMAHSLNLEVIAEGVETEQQQLLLQGNGCNHYQGYLFGKPVPIEEFEADLARLTVRIPES